MNNVSVALGKALDDFQNELNEDLFDAVSKASKMAKRDLVSVQDPRRYGDYARGWAIRTKRERFGIEAVIYNRTYPGLTHLLEKGHVTRNQYGEFKRTPAHPHIEKAKEKAENYLLDLL